MTETAHRSRWSIVIAFALVGAATQVLWVNYAAVTTEAARHFGVSKGAIGWLAQVFPLGYVVLAIPAGVILDRWFRGGLVAGALLTALGGLLRLVDDSFVWALAGQCVIAVGQPLVLNAITGLTGRYLTDRDRAAGISMGSASTFGGLVIGFLLGAALPHANQVPTLVAVGAVIGVASAVVLTAALVTTQPLHVPPRAPAGFGAARVAWRDPQIRRLCALVFIPFGTFIAISTWAQPLLEPAGVTESTAGVMLTLNVVAGVIGCAVIPVWAVRRHSEWSVAGVGVIATSAACLLLALAAGIATGFVALTLIGFALLPALPIVLDTVERRDPDVAGSAAGLVWLAGNLGGLVVATGIGLLVDHPTVAFLTLAVLALVALPILPRRDSARAGSPDMPASATRRDGLPVAGL